MVEAKIIQVEIAVASLQGEQLILRVEVPGNWTIGTIVEHSGIRQRFPELQTTTLSLGVFGKHRSEHDLIEDGDRIEIYSPLLIDPKVARMRRVQKKRL